MDIKKSIDFDDVIGKMHLNYSKFKTIALENKYSELSIVDILFEIEKESRKLEEPETLLFYNRFLQPAENSCIGCEATDMQVQHTVNSEQLLGYEGEELIVIAYRLFLFRRPSLGEISNNLINMRVNGISKIDFLVSLAVSSEAGANGIELQNTKKYLRRAKLKRVLKKIPILGFFIKLIISIKYLPTSMNEAKQSQILLSQWQKEQEIALRIQQNISTDLSQRINAEEQYLKLIQNYIDRQDIKELAKQKQLQVEQDLMTKMYSKYWQDEMNDKPEEEIKAGRMPYVKEINAWFGNQADKSLIKAVDIGCGEGEWVELLLAQGYDSMGVDSNQILVDSVRHCKPKLKMVCSDGVSFLKSMDDASFDIITSFHMIEHLRPVDLYILLEESYRVLKTGGCLLLVTPNIQNLLTSTYMFHMDPTHIQPLPIELLKFYYKTWGFDIQQIIKLLPLDYIPYDLKQNDPLSSILYRFNLEQDYGILGVKK